MKKFIFSLAAVLFFTCGASAGQLVPVKGDIKQLNTDLKKKENIVWLNLDNSRPVTVTFLGDMKAVNFSTLNSRFFFADGRVLTSNLIPPGGLAVISFENTGTHEYRIYGLERDIDGKINVRD